MASSSATDASSRATALPPVLLNELALVGTPRDYPKDAVIVVEGEPSESMYLVLEGTLTVYVDDGSGERAELARLGPGQYFGELMLGSAVRIASVRSLSAAKLCVIGRAEFEAILARRPDLALHVIQTLVARIASVTERFRGLAQMDVYGRVARLLLESAETVDGARVVRGMSRQAIAERVGAPRAAVDRILRDLGAGGEIAIRRGSIELKRGLPQRR